MRPNLEEIRVDEAVGALSVGYLRNPEESNNENVETLTIERVELFRLGETSGSCAPDCLFGQQEVSENRVLLDEGVV